jgi:hypothetical protein
MLFIAVFVSVQVCGMIKPENHENKLTKKEKDAGWILLFDGKTSNGWRGANKEKFPNKGWEIKDGMLTVLGEKGGDIVTQEKYGDFDLHIEFKVNKQNANSGIKYYVLENEYRKGSTLGLEFQTANSQPVGDPKKALGALYDILPARAKFVHFNPAGEWNQVRIVSKKNKVQHWLNGHKVLQYKRGGKKFRKGVSQSKFKSIKNFGEANKGHILLQDHNDKVSFRNIKILEL